MATIYKPGTRVRVDPKFFDPFNIEIFDVIHTKFGRSYYRGFLQNPETGEYDKEMKVKVPGKYIEEHNKGDMICVYGDDGFLKYYFMCLDCGTIAIRDDMEDDGSPDDLGCPECNHIPLEKYDFMVLSNKESDKIIQKIPDECAIEEMRGLEFSAKSIMQGAFMEQLREE